MKGQKVETKSNKFLWILIIALAIYGFIITISSFTKHNLIYLLYILLVGGFIILVIWLLSRKKAADLYDIRDKMVKRHYEKTGEILDPNRIDAEMVNDDTLVCQEVGKGFTFLYKVNQPVEGVTGKVRKNINVFKREREKSKVVDRMDMEKKAKEYADSFLESQGLVSQDKSED